MIYDFLIYYKSFLPCLQEKGMNFGVAPFSLFTEGVTL